LTRSYDLLRGLWYERVDVEELDIDRAEAPRPRKHLPLKDVAEAGGWKSTYTLLRCYTQVYDAGILAVVRETRKVRAGRG